MDEFLYRFRSVEVLLQKYSELENQEIYFASPEELNDPTEGLKDIFWKGDEIVWKNLFKNYLRCLEIFSQHFLRIKERESIENLEMPVFLCEDDLKTEQHKDLQNSIIELFFKSPDVNHFVKKIASSDNPIRREGLYLYLLEIHFRALAIIRSQYQKRGLMNRSHDDKIINEFSETPIGSSELFLLTEEAIKEYPGEGHIDDVLHASIVKIHREMDLLDSVNAHGRENNRNGYFLTRRFPEAYIRAIEQLIYPDWFAACFMGQSSSKNFSAWAHYADNHKGFCLKFKIDRTDGNEIFRLHGINGFSGRKGKTQYNKGEVPIQVRAINYQRVRPELDFFRFIGRLPVPALNKNWYGDEYGKISICADGMMKNEDAWRKSYWERFYHSVTTKTEDWKWENEKRLVLYSHLMDFSSEKNKRKFKYDFSSLDGIIFGIKTSIEDKIAAIKIIKEKCLASGRNDFNFYQAHYSSSSGLMELIKIETISGNNLLSK